MIYDLIHLNGFRYAVDKGKTKAHTWTWLYDFNEFAQVAVDTEDEQIGQIIASSDKSLGLPLLPPFEEDYHQRLKQTFRVVNTRAGKEGNLTIDVLSFEDGEEAIQWCEGEPHLHVIPEYTVVAAKAKQYSEEDVRKAIVIGMLSTQNDKEIHREYYGESTDIISKLVMAKRFPKPLPKQVEVEDYKICQVGPDAGDRQPKPEGHPMRCLYYSDTCGCPTYPVVENNIVKVKRYIYE